MNAGRCRDRLAPWLIAGGAAALYLATASPDCGGVSADAGNYILAMQGISLELGRPHLPGSWLLVVALRGLAPWCGAHGALVAVAIACGAAAAGLGFCVLRRWFAPVDAALLVAAVATQPLVWFHATVAEVYAFDLMFGVLAVCLGRTRRGLLALPVVFALGAGLRLTTPLLLLPLYGWLWHRGRRQGWWTASVFWRAHASAAAVLVLVTWPLLAAAGGLGAYLGLFRTHLTVDWSPARNLWGMSLFLATLVASVLPLAIAGRWRAWRRSDLAPGARNLLLIWLVPPALFFLLGHYQKGYALVLVVPLVALLAARIAARPRRWLLAGLIALQTAYFFATPYRQPPVEILVAPRVRSMGLAEVWWHRVQSTHLMAAARPRALAAVDAELGEMLAAAPADTVFVDPTVPLELRALQVRRPFRAFVVLEVHRRDGWRLHAGTDEQIGTDVAGVLARSLLISRRDFARRELAPLGCVAVREGRRLVALRVGPQAAAAAAARYAALWER
ncbi:MAG: hypothetical protein RBT60_04110 [Candidatus Krumholzibacteria bacterium]|jgi:hypothetical protein|nr:hypothetical protein [Candidatus Krumholzibacteria bacterium]